LPAFQLLFPVYEHGSHSETPEDRRRALQGWVFATIRIDELMQGIVALTEDQVEFDVFEGDATSVAALIYDSDERIIKHRDGTVSDADYAGSRFQTSVPLSLYAASGGFESLRGPDSGMRPTACYLVSCWAAGSPSVCSAPR